MAICTASPIVGAISGNLGGVNFAQTRYGPVIRRALQRTDKKTTPQLASRARAIRITQYWSTITEAQRQTWISAAAGITFPNRLGRHRHLSGFQLFCFNQFGLPESAAPWPLAPEYLTRGTPPADIVLSASAAGAVSVAWTHISPLGLTFVHFFGARSVSNRPHFHFKNWRWLYVDQYAPGARNQVLTAEWDVALAHPLEGELVAIRMYTQHRIHLRSFFNQDTAVTAA